MERHRMLRLAGRLGVLAFCAAAFLEAAGPRAAALGLKRAPARVPGRAPARAIALGASRLPVALPGFEKVLTPEQTRFVLRQLDVSPLLAPEQGRRQESSRPEPGKGRESLPAARGLERLSAQGPGAPKMGAQLKAGQDKVYDGGAGGRAGPPADAVGAVDWTLAPPQLPLPGLKPRWRKASGPSAPDLRYRFQGGEWTTLGEEKDISLVDDLQIEEASEAVADLSPEEALGGIRQERFEVRNGLKQPALLLGRTIAWVNVLGELNLYNRKAGKTVRIRAPMGPIERFAVSQDLAYVYVLAGGTLQRWDLQQKKAVVLLDEGAMKLRVQDIAALRLPDGKGEGLEIRAEEGVVYWTPGRLSILPGSREEIYAEEGVAPSLRPVDGLLHVERVGGSSRLWIQRLAQDPAGHRVADLGTLPHEVRVVAAAADRRTVFAVTEAGLVEWDLEGQRYRLYEVEGLREALAFGPPASLDVSADGLRGLITVGERLFAVDLGEGTRKGDAREAKLRRWAEENPMYIKDGLLHIGEFTFPAFSPAPAPQPWAKRLWSRLWSWLTGRKAQAPGPAPRVSEVEWKALNLPTNKWVIYQTLKGFKLGMNVLYIGETGGGKTWMAGMIAKLLGEDLWMASLTEYTRNQDLISRDTFGEEGENKTGVSKAVVLQWLTHRGILLVDEMHKPLEGVAALNNPFQNREYRMADGTVVRGDFRKNFAIGTMNPTKPPYKGDPPSGELSSRFGITLEVNYLPPAEEAALLSIFHEGIPARLARKLVAIANDLRRIYPDSLPLPVASRTILNAAKHILSFPDDDAMEIFLLTYNPAVILQDSSIKEALEKALEAHGLSGGLGEPEQKKKAPMN